MNTEHIEKSEEKVSTQNPYSFYYCAKNYPESRYQFEEIVSLKNNNRSYGQIEYFKYYILKPGVYTYKFSSLFLNLSFYESLTDNIKEFLFEKYRIDATVFPSKHEYVPKIFQIDLSVPYQIFIEMKLYSITRKIYYYWSLIKSINEKNFIHSPFPNIWSTGEICTGYINNHHIVDSFFEKEFNKDITTNFDFYNTRDIYPFRNIFEWAYESAHDPLFWKKIKCYLI